MATQDAVVDLDDVARPEQAPVRFETKIAVLLRDDLLPWQALNVTAFLASAVAGSFPEVIGQPYADADGTAYLPMFRQPVLVLTGDARLLETAHERALARGLAVAVFTEELFATGHDEANRAAVRAVPTERLDLVGIGLRAPHRDADAILRGLRRHE